MRGWNWGLLAALAFSVGVWGLIAVIVWLGQR